MRIPTTSNARLVNPLNRILYITNIEELKMLTRQQAQIIIDTHEITMDEGEETEMLEENNPELADAYRALLEFAAGVA